METDDSPNTTHVLTVPFKQTHANSIQFVINKESAQETILSKLCFESKIGVLTSEFA